MEKKLFIKTNYMLFTSNRSAPVDISCIYR